MEFPGGRDVSSGMAASVGTNSSGGTAFPRNSGFGSPGGTTGAEANLRGALALLSALRSRGLRHAVLCPGSRSAPLAVASGLLQAAGLRLHTAIDERSAAFFALALEIGRAHV